MSKEEVIDYVMTTPGNPNRAVLSGMLDSIAESSSGDKGRLIIRFTGVIEEDKMISDTTWQQAYDALANGDRVVMLTTLQNGGIQQVIMTNAVLGDEEDELTYEIWNQNQNLYLYANTANGYLYASQ